MPSKNRTEICEAISEMLDNPDECGICSTGRCYDRLERFMGAKDKAIGKLRTALRFAAGVLSTKHPEYTYEKLLEASEPLQTVYKDGEPCDHPGCSQHVTHPCEGCGRIMGKEQRQIRNPISRSSSSCCRGD